MNHYIEDAVRRAIGDAVRGIWPQLPKGCTLRFRRPARGAQFPRGAISFKSKGRTGAAVRAALMRKLAGGEIVLPQPKRRRR